MSVWIESHMTRQGPTWSQWKVTPRGQTCSFGALLVNFHFMWHFLQCGVCSSSCVFFAVPKHHNSPSRQMGACQEQHKFMFIGCTRGLWRRQTWLSAMQDMRQLKVHVPLRKDQVNEKCKKNLNRSFWDYRIFHSRKALGSKVCATCSQLLQKKFDSSLNMQNQFIVTHSYQKSRGQVY